ncbi:MAG: phosphate signaling complex protein PhoU [Clostridia bacterium]
MRERYQAQLEELNQNLVYLSNLCEQAISLAIEGFVKGDKSIADKALAIESQIDEMEKTIERQCLSLLLKQQPMATDLRIVSAALKMITDLERIGDQAEDIASLSKHTIDVNISETVKKMTQEVVKMVVNAVDSYVKQDLELATSVIAYDDVVDDLFAKVKEEIILDIQAGTDNAESIIDTLMIAKYLERIGDHATNVAEWVVFAITGVHDDI